MTDVTTPFLRGVDCEQAGNDSTRQATQVGLRTVKAGPGGHDDGASGGRRGRRKLDVPIAKTGSIDMVGIEHNQWFCKGRE